MTAPLQSLQNRANLARATRGFFDSRQYLEVQTPTLVPCPGTEVHLQYFQTTWRDLTAQDHRLFLRSSPELGLKKVLALGAPRIFELAASFRNHGEVGPWHHPEFTMLEWYQAGLDMRGLIDLTLDYLRTSAEAMDGAGYAAAGRLLRTHLARPVLRLTVQEAFTRFAGVDLKDEDPDLGARAAAAGVPGASAQEGFGTTFDRILLGPIESGLRQEGIAVLTDYPASQCALAVVEGGVANRFEVYVDGIEICNGYQELTDPAESRRRHAQTNLARRRLGYDELPEDPEFFAAMDRGLPPCAGNALGFDRWLALLTDATRASGIGPSLAVPTIPR